MALAAAADTCPGSKSLVRLGVQFGAAALALGQRP